jgi:hypothetical protein
MQLHAVHKEKPTKEFMGRKGEPQKRKARNITRYPAGGAGTASSPGKMISADSDRNHSFFAFLRSISSKDKGIQPRVCFFVPFLAIFDR